MTHQSSFRTCQIIRHGDLDVVRIAEDEVGLQPEGLHGLAPRR